MKEEKHQAKLCWFLKGIPQKVTITEMLEFSLLGHEKKIYKKKKTKNINAKPIRERIFPC